MPESGGSQAQPSRQCVSRVARFLGCKVFLNEGRFIRKVKPAGFMPDLGIHQSHSNRHCVFKARKILEGCYVFYVWQMPIFNVRL
jgi:hypothetical protein